MQTQAEIHPEFQIQRHHNGIKLLRPDAVNAENAASIWRGVSDIDDMPYNVYFMATDHRILKLNQITCRVVGYQSMSDAIGTTVVDICPDQKQALNVLINDDIVVTKKQMQMFDETFNHKDSQRLLHPISLKMPWYDDENHIIGIFGCSVLLAPGMMEQSLHYLVEIGNTFYGRSFKAPVIGRQIQGVFYTPREIDIIRLVLRGKTSSAIATILKLSHRTVQNYFANIKEKAGVNSKMEFIDKVFDEFFPV